MTGETEDEDVRAARLLDAQAKAAALFAAVSEVIRPASCAGMLSACFITTLR